MNLGRYLKAAFLYHWNLLVFLGGMGFAVLSGRPDVCCPLVIAGEVAFLGLLGTHPRFQKYVDARESREQRHDGTASAEQAVRRLLGALPERHIQRFEALRSRCAELRRIAQEIKDPEHAQAPLPLEELHLSGLDRLLWTFLRLLYTQHMLERFLETANELQIKKTIENLEKSIQRQQAVSEEAQKQKVRRALEDNLETSRARLANLQKARDNSELVRLEIDRLENKICSLSEMSVNRQEPDFIAGQVDQVVSGMVQTERTMNDLQFVTGLKTADEAVPQLMHRQVVKQEQQ